MKRRDHTAEQVVSKLPEVDRQRGESTSLMEVCQHPESINATCFRWDNLHGCVMTNDAKPVKDLERDNARLKRLVAQHTLGIESLTKLKWGKLLSPDCRWAGVNHLIVTFEVSQR